MNKDTRGSVGTDDTMGNAIYVVNAETGALIWKARGGGAGAGTTVFEHPGMVDSIPSTLAVGDTDGDGLTDRLYVGDTGGKVWRVDLEGPDTSMWKATVLANLGRHSGSLSIATDRRFFHRPDIVQSQDANGLFDAVVIGSGNRPDPLDYGGLTDNFVYMIKDRLVLPGGGADSTLTHASFGDVTDNCLQAGSCSIDLEDGWRLGLTEIGEKALSTPLTINGKVFFTTYLPKAGTGATACSPSEGGGRLYAVDLQNAFAVLNYNTADDTSDNPDGADTLADRSVELQSLGIPAEVVSIPPNKILRPDLQIDNVDVATRWRTFWYLQEDEDL
jgi:type IV pilus assembly protein PilY1